MIFSEPVKFMSKETRSLGDPAKPFVFDEATIFVPELGRVKVRVVGKPVLPPAGAVVNLTLSPEQGKFQALSVVWDEAAKFTIVK